MYYCKKIKGCHYDVHIGTNFAFLMYISELVFLIIPLIFTNVTTNSYLLMSLPPETDTIGTSRDSNPPTQKKTSH
jgi:hypothetical protein